MIVGRLSLFDDQRNASFDAEDKRKVMVGIVKFWMVWG